MIRNISPRFLIYLAILATSLLLLASSIRWVPNVNAQGLVEYAIILAFVPEADCSVNSYEVEATDSLRVESLSVKGVMARELGQCVISVKGRLRQVGPVRSLSGISVFGDSLQLAKVEAESEGALIDFVYWSNATIESRYQPEFIFYP
jgi:hypothetical protein